MNEALKVDPHSTLWVTDAELIRRFGVPERKARAAIDALDKGNFGFPRKNKLWGDRRYWPAVLEYCKRVGGFPQEQGL